MKAKRSLTVLAVCGIAVVSGVTSLDLIGATGTSNAASVSGRAEAAVLNSAKARTGPSAKPSLSAEEQAKETVRLRNQIEAVAAERKRLQDKSDKAAAAKNAAARRYEALREKDRDASRERASRDRAREKTKGTPREIARKHLPDFGWGDSQFPCLDRLWTKESRWRVTADNPTSSAYGIPQALPGNRMAAFGSDWRTNPVTQIKWGLNYIDNTYGSPCSAWAHSQRKGWY